MKLVQLNIWTGRLLLPAIDFLKEQDADIVCLQEVFSFPSKSVGVLDNLATLEILQKELDYTHSFYAPFMEFNLADMPVRLGNLTLSKHPLDNQEVFFNEGELEKIEKWDERRLNNRNALITQIQTTTRSFTLINHHGHHEFDRLGNEASAAAMKVLAGRIRKIEGPVVVAGDFNVIAESPAMRVYDGWLEDLTATHNVEDTRSKFGKVHGVPCDHILVSKDVKVNSFKVSDALVSDHTPLILEFEV
jgi:endonuclease/exonuclease/phosphatase family metal-dependent hydrolase